MSFQIKQTTASVTTVRTQVLKSYDSKLEELIICKNTVYVQYATHVYYVRTCAEVIIVLKIASQVFSMVDLTLGLSDCMHFHIMIIFFKTLRFLIISQL